MFRYIEPEVPGGLGKETELDSTPHPPLVKKLHLELSGWLGDDILETFPCFIVTESLKNQIEHENLTGISFGEVFVTKSQTFEEIYPNKQLPKFCWAKIHGEFGRDDFSIDKDYRLVVSDNAYKLLKAFNIKNAIFEEIAGFDF